MAEESCLFCSSKDSKPFLYKASDNIIKTCFICSKCRDAVNKSHLIQGALLSILGIKGVDWEALKK